MGLCGVGLVIPCREGWRRGSSQIALRFLVHIVAVVVLRLGDYSAAACCCVLARATRLYYLNLGFDVI